MRLAAQVEPLGPNKRRALSLATVTDPERVAEVESSYLQLRWLARASSAAVPVSRHWQTTRTVQPLDKLVQFFRTSRLRRRRARSPVLIAQARILPSPIQGLRTQFLPDLDLETSSRTPSPSPTTDRLIH